MKLSVQLSLLAAGIVMVMAALAYPFSVYAIPCCICALCGMGLNWAAVRIGEGDQ
jgi:hypothetical protein